MLELREIGKAISSLEGPSPDGFSFVIDRADFIPARRDQFVSVEFEDGTVVARIENIRKTNKYFARAETVREYGKDTDLSSLFPIDSWEFLVADARVLGVFASDGKIIRSTYPISPGAAVKEIEGARLSKFLGFEEKGLDIGRVEHHDIPVKINPTRLLQKHLAILAMSGAGKSHLTRVLIEELLDRKKEQGRLAVVVIDVHGEYSSFADPGLYNGRTTLVDCAKFKIPVPDLSAREICTFNPSITASQRRLINSAIATLKKNQRETGKAYEISDIVREIEAAEEGKKDSKTVAIGWLEDLDSSRIFSATGFPAVSEIIAPGILTVFDLSGITSTHTKQIIVSYVSRKLFELRKRNACPPYAEIVEEAHNFVPQGESRENAVARWILEVVAREGRKFCASLVLISQRPVRLSTTILSQCNTHIILRVTNPNDLDHIGQSSEGISSDTLSSITGLRVGEALLVGEGVNYPTFVKIRDRKSPPPRHSLGIEEAARAFEERASKRAEDADAFV
ncbi:MAG: ATP-binding protein [archaeon]